MEKRITYIVGDREFIGRSWIKYLKNKGVRFVMRVTKHHTITRPDGTVIRIGELNLKVDKALILKDCLVDSVVADVWVKLLETGDFLFLIGTVNAEFIGQLYRKRWTI